MVEFQARAVCHFARNILLRTITSTLQLEDRANPLKAVKAKNVTCKITAVFISQDQRVGMIQLK